MRVLIQKSDTKEFFVEPDRWTAEPSKALNFSSVVDAVEFVTHRKMQGVRLVMKFDVPGFDITFSDTGSSTPVPPSGDVPPSQT